MSTWVRQHQRAAGIAVTASALTLLGTAIVLASAILNGSRLSGEAEATSTPIPPAMTWSPAAEPSASASANVPESPSAAAAASRCSGSVLLVDCFARVTVDALKLRTGPGLDAPQVVEFVADAPSPFEVLIGQTSGREHVFIVDGPVQADGLAWYQVGVMNTEQEQSTGPLFVGWVASGDGTDPWLVPEDPCPPAGPVDLAALADADTAWAIHLGCFGDQLLTLRGWFPLLPPEFEIPYDTDGSCFAEPAFLMCGPYNKDIRTMEVGFYEGGTGLNFTVDPAAGVELPSRGQWIEITGAFDHPAAQQCGSDAGAILVCRAVFVATDVSVTE